MKNSTAQLTMTAILTALLAVMAQIAIPIPISPVPITLQTAALVVAILVGPGWTPLYTCLIYLFLGCVGLPVFAGFKAGVGVLVGPTGGFLLGFIPAVILASLYWQRLGRGRIVAAYGAALIFEVISLLGGSIWFSFLTGSTWPQALALTVVPFLLGDALKIIVFVPVAWAVRRALVQQFPHRFAVPQAKRLP